MDGMVLNPYSVARLFGGVVRDAAVLGRYIGAVNTAIGHAYPGMRLVRTGTKPRAGEVDFSESLGDSLGETDDEATYQAAEALVATGRWRVYLQELRPTVPMAPKKMAPPRGGPQRGGHRHPHHGRAPRREVETLHVHVNQVLPDGTIELTRPSVTGYGLERVAVPAFEVLARGVAANIPADVAMMQAIRHDLNANIIGPALDLAWSGERDDRGRMKGELHGRKGQPKGFEPGQAGFSLDAYLRRRFPKAFPAR